MQSELKLFGFPLFTMGGNVLEIKSRKGLALVSYLAVSGKMNSRDLLAALFWPEHDQARARGNLRQVLHILRQNPIGDWLQIHDNLLQIQVPLEGKLDIQEFQTLTELISAKDFIPQDAMDRLITLYRGDFLEGFSIPGSAEFEQWLILQREIFRSWMLQSLDLLSEHFIDNRLYTQVEVAARKAVSLDPFRESARRHLMLAYASNGNYSQARSEYKHYVEILQNELGLKPEAELRELSEQISSGRFERRKDKIDHRALATRIPAEIQHNVPASTNPLVGRQEEVNQVLDYLRDPMIRVITITGEGGIGKTRLALEVTRNLIEQFAGGGFSDGVYYVPLNQLDHPDYIVSTIAKQIGFSMPRSGNDNSLDALCNYLASKKMLLLLDNFEHLIQGSDILLEIVQTSPHIKLLITSREPLRLRAEQIVPLDGLLGEDDRARQELFLQAALRVQPGFKLNQENLPALESLLQLTQGIPLAIEIAATWVVSLPLTKIAEEIEQGLDLLETDIQDLPERHRSMKAIFDASFYALDENEKKVLSTLSTFQGGFTRKAAVFVSQADLQILSRLVGRSLLRYDLQADRYHLHDLLQKYLKEKLADGKSLEIEARDRYCRYYSDLLISMRKSVLAGWEEQALQEIDLEIDNIRSFWYMVIKKGDFESLGCTSFILHHYYLRRNLFEEGAHMFQAAVDQVWDDSDEVIQLIRARLQNFLAEFLWNSGKYDGARSLVEEASRTTKDLQIDARWDIAFSKYMLGQINPNLDQKTRLHRESLEIFIRIPDAYRQATELAILGSVMHNSGQFIKAEEYTRKSLSIFKHLNNPYTLAKTTGILGFQMLLMGDLDQAQHYLNESIDIADECNASDLIVVGMNWLSQAYLLQGNFMQAEERIKNSLEGAKRIGFVHFIIHSTNISGLIKLFRGRYQDARNLFTLALDQVLRIGRKDYEGLSKMLIAAAAIAQQEVSFALTLIDDSVEIFRDLSRADSLAEALLFAGLIYTHAGNIEGGSKLIREGWKILRDLHQYHIYLTGLSAAALYFVKIGEKNKAVEIYSLASNQPLVAASPWYERIVGDYIKMASGEISQEELNNALKRGRALSIWGAPEILLDWLR